jgi:YVTN family beta-propeller protein
MPPSPLPGLRAAALLLALAGCAGAMRSARLAPLEGEGEVWVYLQPLPRQAERLSFSVESVAAVRAEGGEAPLRLVAADLSGKEAGRQRLLATGRLPPGSYSGLLLRFRKASVTGESGAASMLVPTDPVAVSSRFAVARGQAVALQLTLEPGRASEKEFAFAPAFAAAVPGRPLPELLGVASVTGAHALAFFDKRTRMVTGIAPTGREPQGLVLDPRGDRVYVALSGDDQVQALDLVTGAVLDAVRLQPGDRPREVGLTPDGRTLVVVNYGSNSVSFVDPSGLVELSRVPTGLQPWALVMDRNGRRAYVFNRGSSSITVLDLATRAVAATVAAEPEPLRGSINLAGNRLYVVAAGSPTLVVYSLPDLRAASRFHVGLGVTGVKVDTRTGLLYVARDQDRLDVYDPNSFLPVYSVETPGPATLMVVDGAYNALFAVVPGERMVAAVDLVTRRLLAAMEVADEPYQAAVAGERP